MPTYDNNAVSKRILPIFILLAPVNSKTQSNLQQTLIDSLIKQLSELEDTVAKVSFLHIGHLTEKQQTGLVDSFVEIERPHSLNLDDAFSLLEQALSRKTMLRVISSGCYLPSFIFIGDCGQDLCQYTQRLQANDWFRRGRKMAIIYSKDSSAHFDSFCDLSECCFLCHSVDNCDNIIKSVTYIAGRTANPLSGSIIVSCPDAQVDDSEDNLVQVDPVEPNNSDKDSVDDGWDSWDDEEPRSPVAVEKDDLPQDCDNHNSDGRMEPISLTGLWVDTPTGDFVRTDPTEPNDPDKNGTDNGWDDEGPW